MEGVTATEDVTTATFDEVAGACVTIAAEAAGDWEETAISSVTRVGATVPTTRPAGFGASRCCGLTSAIFLVSTECFLLVNL